VSLQVEVHLAINIKSEEKMGQILTYKYEYSPTNLNWSVVNCSNFQKLNNYLKFNSILVVNCDKLTNEQFRFLINAKSMFNDLKVGFIGDKFPCPGFFTDLNFVNVEAFIRESIKNRITITDKRLLLKSIHLLNKPSLTKNNKLLVFDMDGTILKSDEYSIESIQLAMRDLFDDYAFDGEVISVEKIHSFIGAPHTEFYKSVLPQEMRQHWNELHERVFAYEAELLPIKGKCFPTVEDTLYQLKADGYKMTLASNCSYDYFKKVIESLKLERFFENCLCVGQRPGKTKTDLILEQKKYFKSKKAIFMGDRIYDIEAGLNADCFTIGAEFGYGKENELYYSHYNCREFSDLLNVL
jgi:phosphoglycolate phosphatase